MKICILENDVLDAEMATVYTSYGAMFTRLLREAGATDWTIDAFNSTRREWPSSFDDYDAVLLTGGRTDSFSQELWVQELRQRVEQLLKEKKKLVGVCFGHQLIALCLGSKVARSPNGWGYGRMTYQWLAPELAQAGGRTEISLLASHQDQVFDLPPGATLLARSDFCPVAAYSVGQEVFCVQAHPEFVERYSNHLLNKRRTLFGEEFYASARDSIALGHEGHDMARMMVAFIEGQQPATA